MFNDTRAKSQSTATQNLSQAQKKKPQFNIGQENAAGKNQLMKILGGILIVAAVISFVVAKTPTPAANTPPATVVNTITEVSTTLPAGAVLSEKDGANALAKDYTIVHNADVAETTIWVWDYADVDGDWVQILADGAPLTEPFMITHGPKAISVPAVGVVQVKGVVDGGGGITYAVKYDVNGTTYFNQTNPNKLNTYTLTRK